MCVSLFAAFGQTRHVETITDYETTRLCDLLREVSKKNKNNKDKPLKKTKTKSKRVDGRVKKS